MDNLIKLTKLLPNYEEIQLYCNDEAEATYIFKLATSHIQAIQLNRDEVDSDECQEICYLLQALVDRCWERIHTGHFSEVPLSIRKVYAIANYFKIFYFLFESLEAEQVERCSEMLDNAILVGCTQELYTRNEELQLQLTQLFDGILAKQIHPKLPVIAALPRQDCICDIKHLQCPSVATFRVKHFDCLQPALLLNTIEHWPALQKWRDLNYILRTAGNRRVPIEIGSNYATDDWSQQMVKLRDFLQRQFSASQHQSQPPIEYLAQHELFDQIPALKADICIPDYCTLGTQTAAAPDIKAWLGPKGTISPLHYDPKHNLLCQVFGMKKLLLAAPESTDCLYPHESDFLSNTSQIDAEHLDLDKFPMTSQVKFVELTLQAGDCVYIPPKWWHYVRSLSPSFSVSFWWE